MDTLKLVLLVLAVLIIIQPIAARDIDENCPRKCKCSLATFPNINCQEYTSLPRIIPKTARSLQCADCPIGHMTGDTYQNYTHLSHLSLAGSTHLIFNERNLHFLSSVPVLELKRFNITDSDLLYIISGGHTVLLQNITVVRTSSVSALSSSTTSATRVSADGGAPIGKAGLLTIKVAAGDHDSTPGINYKQSALDEDISITPSVTRKDEHAYSTTEDPGVSNGSSTLIAGFTLCISAIILLFIVVAVVFWLYKKRNRYQQVSSSDALTRADNVLGATSDQFIFDSIFVVGCVKVLNPSGCGYTERSISGPVAVLLIRAPEKIFSSDSSTDYEGRRGMPLVSIADNSSEAQHSENLQVVSDSLLNSSGDKSYLTIPRLPYVAKEGIPESVEISLDSNSHDLVDEKNSETVPCEENCCPPSRQSISHLMNCVSNFKGNPVDSTLYVNFSSKTDGLTSNIKLNRTYEPKTRENDKIEHLQTNCMNVNKDLSFELPHISNLSGMQGDGYSYNQRFSNQDTSTVTEYPMQFNDCDSNVINYSKHNVIISTHDQNKSSAENNLPNCSYSSECTDIRTNNSTFCVIDKCEYTLRNTDAPSSNTYFNDNINVIPNYVSGSNYGLCIENTNALSDATDDKTFTEVKVDNII